MRVLLLLYFWSTAFKVQRSKEEQYQHVSRFFNGIISIALCKLTFGIWLKTDEFPLAYFSVKLSNYHMSKATTEDLAETSVIIKHRYSNKKINRHLSCCLASSFLLGRKALQEAQSSLSHAKPFQWLFWFRASEKCARFVCNLGSIAIGPWLTSMKRYRSDFVLLFLYAEQYQVSK